jgi:hypothetical protein
MTQSTIGTAAKFANAAHTTEVKTAPTTKKPNGKAKATTKAAPKKAGPKKAATERRSPYPKDAVIVLHKKDQDKFHGKRGEAISVLRDGMTVEKFHEALVKLSMGEYVGMALRRAIDLKMITVKTAK